MAPTPISVRQGAAAAPVGYVLAGGSELDLASATAQYDGSAAAGPFRPSLAFYAPDGTTLISRATAEQTLQVGDDAKVSWFPRLAKAATPGATLNAIHLYEAGPLLVPSNNDQRVGFTTVSSFDSTVFATTLSAGKVVRVTCKKQGLYSVFCFLTWSANIGASFSQLYHLYVGDTLSSFGQVFTNDSGTHVQTWPILTYSRVLPSATGFGDALPSVVELWINQNTGANKNAFDMFQEITYHGATDF